MDSSSNSDVQHTLLAVAAILTITALVFFCSPYDGLQLTYDSYDYLNASESVETYLHGKNQDGFAYLVRPPLYPAILTLFQDKVSVSQIINVVSLVVCLFLIYQIAALTDMYFRWRLVCVITTAFSYPWLQNHFFLWTEPLFCVLFFLTAYLHIKQQGFGWVLFICVLAYLLRKAGMFLGSSVLLFLLLHKQYKKFFMLIVTLVVTVIGWEVVTIRHAETSTSLITFGNLTQMSRWDYADAITAWWLPRKIPLIIRVVICLSGILVLLVVFKTELRKLISKHHIRVLICLAGGYLLAFIILVGIPEYNDAERYASPVIPLAIVLLVCTVHKLVQGESMRNKVVYSLAAIWLIYPVARTISHFL